MKLTVNLLDAASVAAALALLPQYADGSEAAAPAAAPARAAPARAAPAAGAARPGPAAPARAAAAPTPAARHTPPAPAAAAPNEPDAAFSQQVQTYAGVYGPKATKARFAQVSEAFGANPAWTKTSDIPADMVEDVTPWFVPEEA